jgi:hypothetical protein
MKKTLLSIFLITSLLAPSSSHALVSPALSNVANRTSIDDGWYSAIVKYMNPNTYTTSKYRLNVKVQYNRVVAIDFGNGGSVHSGFNNEGYFYTGGTLSSDYSGNVTATVSVSQGSQLLYYNITLE